MTDFLGPSEASTSWRATWLTLHLLSLSLHSLAGIRASKVSMPDRFFLPDWQRIGALALNIPRLAEESPLPSAGTALVSRGQ